jgi:hypothetical protein
MNVNASLTVLDLSDKKENDPNYGFLLKEKNRIYKSMNKVYQPGIRVQGKVHRYIANYC